jgi:uncharacterized protein
LRIKNGKEPLDMTGIHPEIHKQVYTFINEELKIKKSDLKLPLTSINFTPQQLRVWSEKYEIGFATMEDVVRELQRPGLDPREDIDPPSFKSDVLEVKDVKV